MATGERCKICDRQLATTDTRIGDDQVCWRVWSGDATDCLSHSVNWRAMCLKAEQEAAALRQERDELRAHVSSWKSRAEYETKNVEELVGLLRDLRRAADRYSVISIVHDIDDAIGEKGWLRHGKEVGDG